MLTSIMHKCMILLVVIGSIFCLNYMTNLYAKKNQRHIYDLIKFILKVSSLNCIYVIFIGIGTYYSTTLLMLPQLV